MKDECGKVLVCFYVSASIASDVSVKFLAAELTAPHSVSARISRPSQRSCKISKFNNSSVM